MPARSELDSTMSSHQARAVARQFLQLALRPVGAGTLAAIAEAVQRPHVKGILAQRLVRVNPNPVGAADDRHLVGRPGDRDNAAGGWTLNQATGHR